MLYFKTLVKQFFSSPIKVLQSPKPGANIPGFGSEGVSQVFQHIAQSFMPGGNGELMCTYH